MNQYTQYIQKYIQITKTYLAAHRQDIKIATPIVIIVTALVGTIAFAALHDMPNIVYQPVKACDLLTLPEAKELLGDKLNGVDKNEPIISGDTRIDGVILSSKWPGLYIPEGFRAVSNPFTNGMNLDSITLGFRTYTELDDNGIKIETI